jgi:hypothetical protein
MSMNLDVISRNTFSASHNLITDLNWIAESVFAGDPALEAIAELIAAEIR